MTLNKIRRRAHSLSLRRKTVTIYVPATDHIYYDGLSYRVRVTRDGVRRSENFRSFHKALNYKKKLLRGWA